MLKYELIDAGNDFFLPLSKMTVLELTGPDTSIRPRAAVIVRDSEEAQLRLSITLLLSWTAGGHLIKTPGGCGVSSLASSKHNW